MISTTKHAIRESGHEWLGGIPAHWQSIPFRHIFQESSEVNGLRPVGEMLSISGYRGVEIKEYSSDSMKRDDDQLETYRVVRVGQLAANTMWLNYAGLGVSKFEGHMSPAYRSYDFKMEVNRDYIQYLLRSQSYVEGYTARLQGVRPNSLQMSRESLMTMPVLIPPRAEQDEIVEFLDRELAQIDKLIDLQLELSALLSNRKYSLVSSAVYGLGNTDSLSASPILPHGWVWRKLKGVVTLQASNVDKKSYEDGFPVRLCNYVDVYYNDEIHDGLDFMEATASKNEIKTFTLRAGDVIITKDSESEADIGIPSYVPNDLPGVVCGYHLTILRTKGALEPRFLKLVLESSQAKSHFAKRANGLTRMALGQGAIGDLAVPIPPLEVQERIATAIWQKLGTLNEAIIGSSSLVQKLRERRSALISAAVTGKLEIKKGGRNG